MDYVLDSNVFDYLLNEKVDLDILQTKCNLYVTNVQISEISNIPSKEKRIELQKLLSTIKTDKLLLESGIWCDNLKWDDEQPWIDEVSSDCQEMVGNSTKGSRWHDALIGAVAKKNGFLLVTNDSNFSKKAVKAGIQTLTPEQLCAKYV